MDIIELRKLITKILEELLSKGYIESDDDSYISESDSIS